MSKEQAPKIALVTGAGKGIGRALVPELLERGYMVIAVTRTAEDVDALAATAPGQVLSVLCDITQADAEAVLSAFLAEKNITHIDLLINNAGHGATKYGIANMDFDELNKVIAVSCHGPARVTRACLPLLRKGTQKVVINVSSRFASLEWVANGVLPHEDATYPYRIAKAAMNMFTSCLAAELRAENFRVLAVDPGKVKTRFGPRDADTAPADAARAIVNLAEQSAQTGAFVHASGEKVPW